MKFVLLTCMISPHQSPLIKSLLKYWHGQAQYQYTEPMSSERSSMGWDECPETNFTPTLFNEEEALNAEALLCGLRTLDLYRKRVQTGRWTGYMFERWFKPPWGIFRLFWPPYFHMAKEIIRLGKIPSFYFFPIGIHAARDLARLEMLLKGNLKALFYTPSLAFESKPGGTIVSLKTAIDTKVLSPEEIAFAKKYGFVQIPKKYWGKVKPSGIFAKFCLWGYFVASGKITSNKKQSGHPHRLLWVGRMLSLKRVDTIVQAVKSLCAVSLNLYGHGPMEKKLQKMSAEHKNICFHDFVPVTQVRCLMRIYDTYILSSNAYEGWGAVVSEALEEGMRVFATIESGAGSTILPRENLFPSGDTSALIKLLQTPSAPGNIGLWTAEEAAKVLVEQITKSASERR